MEVYHIEMTNTKNIRLVLGEIRDLKKPTDKFKEAKVMKYLMDTEKAQGFHTIQDLKVKINTTKKSRK